MALSVAQRARVLAPAFWRDYSIRQSLSPTCPDRLAGALVSQLSLSHERDAFMKTAQSASDAALVAATHCSFVDKMVLDAVGRRLRQIVFLGSAMDTRAFRLDVPPQLKIVEVDEAEVHQAKEAVLAEAGERARCALHKVDAMADFISEGALPIPALSKVLDSRRPSLFIVDDLLSLWTQEAQCRALAEAGSIAGSGSRLLAQLRPQPPKPFPDIDSIRSVLHVAGWERIDVVGHKALSRFFPRAPTDEVAVLVVAERGAPVSPGRPPAERGRPMGGDAGGSGPREASF